MAQFGKCKDCGDRNPASGWVGTSTSLCADCASTRQERWKAITAAEYNRWAARCYTRPSKRGHGIIASAATLAMIATLMPPRRRI